MQNNSFRGAKPRPNNRFKVNRNRSGGGGGSRGPKKQSIHPSKFINKTPVEQQQVIYESTHAFTDFALNTRLQQNLVGIGYDSPSAIQDQAIPLALSGRDVIGLANTGTGKTAAFLLPILEKLNADERRNSVLIMAPTRELAQQIDEEFKRFSRDLRLFSTVVVGGTNIDRQIRDLRRNPHVIIGTPGRLKDLIKRKALRLNEINTFVSYTGHVVSVASMRFLEKQNLVALEGSQQDPCYVLTATGREASLQQLALAKAVEENVSAKLGPGDAQALKVLLKRLIAASDPGLPDLWAPR